MTKPHTTLSEAVRAMASMNPHAHGTFSAIEWDDGFNAALSAAADLVEKAEGQEPVAHPDDLAVDRCAVAMKAKMAASRAKGRGGWDDESQCTMGTLAKMLVEHVAKGDPIDIANFAMMLHQREAAAIEHHPCYGGAAAKAIKAYAQPTLAATTPVDGCQGERAADEKVDGLSEDEKWHSLTCDGTCSPPCKDAPPLQRYVWGGAPTAPLKHLTAHEGPFYACADVDALLPTASTTPVAEDTLAATQAGDADRHAAVMAADLKEGDA